MLTREEAIDTLKRYWKVNEFRFLAEFFHAEDKEGKKESYGFFNLKSNDRALLFPKPKVMANGYTNARASAFYEPATDYVHNKTYEVLVDLEPDELRIEHNNDYLLRVIKVYEIPQSLDVISPRQFIAKWFGLKGENPEDAASIASQLRLNQLELYTQTKRFIFELIQNADDMPVIGKDVEINIRLLKDYFIFQHTGQYFNRGNVRAICDAAQSTKRNDETKTGYKGIGFKSVFSDCDQVYIYSQDYSFKFDKHASVYNDFIILYKPYWQKLTEDARQEFFIESKGQEEKYSNIDNIPWQIKPIWIDLKEYPTDLYRYIDKRKNVNISLGVGEAKIQEKNYNGMIQELVADPRFLLFLRNTRKIQYTSAEEKLTTIQVEKTEDETRVYANDHLESVYSTFQDDVAINNEAFASAGFDLEHIEVDKDKWIFRNKEGKILENIPEKLGKLKETTLSFAVKQNEEKKIVPVSESESILFNYLPTSDYNYKLPFIVNADFVSKTDREGILAENIWNHYLFFHIGFSLVKWVNTLVDKGFLSTALKVLPRVLLDESNVDRRYINAAFNWGLKKGISEIAFIMSHGRKKIKCDEAIFDSIGIAAIIGPRELQEFLGTDKQLVNWKFEFHELKIPYLGIERIDKKVVLDRLKYEQALDCLNKAILALTNEKYIKFLEWLNQADFDYTTLSKLKFVRFGASYYSLADINVENSTLFIKDDIVSTIPTALISESALVSDFSYTDFANLRSIIDINLYISEGSVYAAKLVSAISTKLYNMSIENRLSIITALRNIGGIDLKYVAKLPWFKNNLGELKSLQELYVSDGFIYSSKYNSFFISDDEYRLLSKDLQKELKPFVSLLDDENYILNFYSNVLNIVDDLDLRFLNKFIDLAENDANIYKKLAHKIQINDQFIDGELWTDEVVLKYNDKNQREQIQSSKLVQIKNDLQTKNNLFEELLKIIPNSQHRIITALRNEIFHLKAYPDSKIDYYLRTEFTGTLNYDQLLFLVIRNWIVQKNIIDLKSSRVALSDTEKEKLLDSIYAIGITHQSFKIIVNGKDIPFIEKDKFAIIDNDILGEDEQVSNWMKNWVNGNQSKIDFLINLGCYGSDNIHYKFRQALSSKRITEALGLISSINKSIVLLENTTKHVKKFAENIYLGNIESVNLVVEYYNKLSSFDLSSNAYFSYPTLDFITNTFKFKDLSAISRIYKYNKTIDKEYSDIIINYVRDEGNVFIPNTLQLPSQFLNKVKSIEIETSVNEGVLKASSQLFDAEYYQVWDKKDKYQIYIYDNDFIPFKSTFENLILDDNYYSDQLIYTVGNSYYVCRSEMGEIPLNLNSIPSDDWRNLVEQSYFYKKSVEKKNDDNLSKYDLTEEEEEAFSKLFGYNLSKPDKRIWNALAIFKAIRYYEDKGYEMSAVWMNIQQVIKQNFFTILIQDTETRIYPRSARKNLLFVSIQLWNAMLEIPSIIFCLSKHSELVIIEDIKSLVNQDINVIFKISTDNDEQRKEIIDSFFRGKSINEFQYHSTVTASMILRLHKDSEYSSVFDGMDF